MRRAHLAGFVFAAAACALFAVAPGSAAPRAEAAGAARVRALVVLPHRVDGFAQSAGHVAWTRGTRSCRELVLQRLATGTRTTLARDCSFSRFEGVGLSLLVGERAYWEVWHPANTYETVDLLTVSARDRRVRELAFQSIAGGADGGSFDRLVPAVDDGRSVYFWTSPGDASPGPIRRFDGVRRTTVTATLGRAHLLAAGGGRFAFARAQWTYDCAQEPSWSRDGKRIAFSSSPGWEWYGKASSRRCRGGVWVVNADGSGLRQVAVAGRGPAWSPDGTRLVYEDGTGRLTVHTDGALPAFLGEGRDPSWSPDGTRIAFARGTAVFVALADGSGARLIASGAAEPDWSPDGTRLVFRRIDPAQAGLSVVGSDGAGERVLTRGFHASPAWSPDGRLIAFSSNEAWWGEPVVREDRAQSLSLVAPDGSGLRELTFADGGNVAGDDGHVRTPAWSPDSKRLVFSLGSEYWDEGDSHLAVAVVGQGPAQGRVRDCCERLLTATPRPQTPVVVRSRSGRTVASFVPEREALALAVSRTTIAALVRGPQRARLEIYAPTRRTVTFAQQPSLDLLASGTTVVVRVGRALYAVDAPSGKRRLLTRTRGTPLGLSLAGRRLAWAENGPGRATIYALELPA